jgi:hypothetical protein
MPTANKSMPAFAKCVLKQYIPFNKPPKASFKQCPASPAPTTIKSGQVPNDVIRLSAIQNNLLCRVSFLIRLIAILV